MRRDGKCQAHIHSARETLYRSVEKFFDLGESDNLIEPHFDLGTTHSEDCSIQIDIFACGQFGMKSGAHLKQTCDPSFDSHFSRCWLRDSRQDLEQCRFSGPISTDNSDHFAFLHLKRNVAESPQFFSSPVKPL